MNQTTLFDQFTKHLHSCECIPGININVPVVAYKSASKAPPFRDEPISDMKPLCCEEVDQRRCGGLLCYLGCLRVDPDDGICYGYCWSHWKKYCDDIATWSSHLSYCANTRCDQKKLSYKDRLKINSKNIKEKIYLPGDKRYNHVTDYISYKEESDNESLLKSSSESSADDCYVDDDSETISYENSKEETSEESYNENITNEEITYLKKSDIVMIDLTGESNESPVRKERRAKRKASRDIIRIAKFRRIFPDRDYSSRSVDSDSETDDGFIDYS